MNTNVGLMVEWEDVKKLLSPCLMREQSLRVAFASVRSGGQKQGPTPCSERKKRLARRAKIPYVAPICGHGPVAQLDRVLPSEGKGHAFESRRVHHERNGAMRPLFFHNNFMCLEREKRSTTSNTCKRAANVYAAHIKVLRWRAGASPELLAKAGEGNRVGSAIKSKT